MRQFLVSIPPQAGVLLLAVVVAVTPGCARIAALTGQEPEPPAAVPETVPPEAQWVAAAAALGRGEPSTAETGAATDAEKSSHAADAAEAPAEEAKAAGPGGEKAGYSLYTYVLLGDALRDLEGEGVHRYRQLLWVIQAQAVYAQAESGGESGPPHTFMVPARTDRGGKPLLDQTDQRLSARTRSALADHLSRTGRVALGQRFSEASGPFLLSAPEPTPVPVESGEGSPRLLVDLSGIAPEYMYAVIDAYGPATVPDEGDASARLDAIRERLTSLFPPVPGEGDPPEEAVSDSQNQWAVLVAPVPSPAKAEEPPGEPALDEPVVPKWQWATSAGCHESKGWRRCESGR